MSVHFNYVLGIEELLTKFRYWIINTILINPEGLKLNKLLVILIILYLKQKAMPKLLIYRICLNIVKTQIVEIGLVLRNHIPIINYLRTSLNIACFDWIGNIAENVEADSNFSA